jgi:hypothetical protein
MLTRLPFGRVKFQNAAVVNAMVGSSKRAMQPTRSDAPLRADFGASVDQLGVAEVAYQRASARRAALGGYLPRSHPDHPSKWTASRRVALSDAQAELDQAWVALSAARAAACVLSG